MMAPCITSSERCKRLVQTTSRWYVYIRIPTRKQNGSENTQLLMAPGRGLCAPPVHGVQQLTLPVASLPLRQKTQGRHPHQAQTNMHTRCREIDHMISHGMELELKMATQRNAQEDSQGKAESVKQADPRLPPTQYSASKFAFTKT